MALSPPKWAQRFLQWYCNPEFLECIEGDFNELFQERAQAYGLRKARRAYIRDVFRSVRPYTVKQGKPAESGRGSADLWRSYRNVAWRHLARNKVYSTINITGIAVASAFCLLVYAFIEHERSFDRFHAKAGQLYRVEISGLGEMAATGTSSFFSSLGQEDNSRYTRLPPDLAPDLATSLPGVKSAFRFTEGNTFFIKARQETFLQDNICLVDSNFFDLFSFPLRLGNPAVALRAPNGAVLSETAARRYFGNRNPIGLPIEVIHQERRHLLTVTGVAADCPANSSIYFDVLIPFHAKGFSAADVAPRKSLDALFALSVIELAPHTDAEAFRESLRQFGKGYYRDQLLERKIPVERFGLVCTPLADTHLDNIAWGWPRMGKRLNHYVLSFVAVLVLLIAGLNYVFLAVTQASARQQEVGIRKTNGASRFQLVGQLWLENFVLVLVAVALGFVLASLGLPLFNRLLDNPVPWLYFFGYRVGLAVLLLALGISTLTGIYPALLLSGFKATSLLQGKRTYRFNPLLAHSMSFVQYALCLFLITSVMIMREQYLYISEKKLGFDKEHVVVIDLFENQAQSEGAQLLGRFKQLVASEPDLVAVSGGDQLTGASGIGFYNISGQDVVVNQLAGDSDYLQLLGLKLVKGRFLSSRYPSDTTGAGAVVVNESLAKLLGKDCGQDVPCRWLKNARVVGVMKDFHFASLSQPIGPALLRFEPDYIPSILIKIRPGNVPATLAKIERAWKRYNGDKPLHYSFLDQNIDRMYASQQRWVRIIGLATVLAVVTSCIGLFGLSGLVAVNRTKEISIRKVMGASVPGIFMLLNRNTIRMALLSFVLAAPFAWYVMKQWLNDFAYRVPVSWPVFVTTWMMGLLVALAAVSYHSIKTALTNPAKSLQN